MFLFVCLLSLAGISRSVTIAAAYLASVTKFNCNETLNLIRNIRQISAPNPGFYKQLLDFETYRLRQERNRIVMEYHFGLIANDEIEVNVFIICYSKGFFLYLNFDHDIVLY